MKSIGERTVDAGKYVVPSTAIASMIVVLIPNKQWSVDEVAIIVGGLTVVVNLISTIGVGLLKRWELI